MNTPALIYSPIEDRMLTWDEVKQLREERTRMYAKIEEYKSVLLKIKQMVHKMK